jgi:flagellum-specific ATP synthase
MTLASLERLAQISEAIFSRTTLLKKGGRIVAIRPDILRVAGLQNDATINCRVEFETISGTGFGTVVQIENADVLIAPFGDTANLKIGDPVFLQTDDETHPSERWLGRVVNALGEPIDGKGRISTVFIPRTDVADIAIPPMRRGRVEKAIVTGIRAIDIFMPICYGQRVGIFAGSGVGKSTLLGMLTQTGAFDCIVVALVGERGREVREFLEDSIGSEAMRKTVAIIATSDESALMRITAPQLAMKTAAVFRDKGQRVLLLLDSITRFAHALREAGSTAGEAPVARGYPASVFSQLPKLLECAGPGPDERGSITALATVLVDGDDHNDPISDAVRGILDGHIVLDREIANLGRYPPINLLSSLSRLAPRVWTPEQQKLVLQLRSMIAKFEDTRDLRMIGSWRAGEDEELDRAVATVPGIYSALIQSPAEPPSKDAFSDLLIHLKRLSIEKTAVQKAG